METETGSGKQTVFLVVMGQKNTTHKVWAKSETMRAGPLCRYFGAYMELLLSCAVGKHQFRQTMPLSTIKILKFGTPQTIAIIVLKIEKNWCNITLMHPKDAGGMANGVDPDQTASSEAVWSWSALFAETYLSQYIEFVR